MIEFCKNIVELAKLLWAFFLEYPFYTLFAILSAILAVLAVIRIEKVSDQAKGPIIIR